MNQINGSQDSPTNNILCCVVECYFTFYETITLDVYYSWGLLVGESCKSVWFDQHKGDA